MKDKSINEGRDVENGSMTYKDYYNFHDVDDSEIDDYVENKVEMFNEEFEEMK